MICSGLHCPGCSEGQSLGIAGGAVLGLVLLDQTVQWVAARIWWIGGTLALCFAVSIAVSLCLERWADARGARFAAAHGILSRADVILPGPVRAGVLPPRQIGTPVPIPAAEIRTPGSDSGRPAIGPAEVHLHFHGLPGDQQAALIRAALPGTAGGFITEEE